MALVLVLLAVRHFIRSRYRDMLATDHREVLELPFGVRDGTSSHGNFTARSQFFQTYHHKPLIGGYLSRVFDEPNGVEPSTLVT